MEIILLLLRQIFIMFIYMGIGYFLFKKKLVSLQGCGDLGRMLLYIIMPCAIIKSYLTEFTAEKARGLAISFVIAALSLLLSILLSRLFFKKDQAMERFSAAFSNAGFIGIPLVQLTIGDQYVFYVAAFVALLNILQWTYGVYTITEDKSTISFAKIRTNPIVLSFLAGIILFVLPFNVPSIIQTPIAAIAAMNGPLAMIVLGIYLAQIPLKSIFTDKLAIKCTVVRLIVIPALTILLMLIFPVSDPMIKIAILIVAATPVGSNVAIYAQLYNKDYTAAVREICNSTIFCIITLPVVIGIANMFL